MISQLPLYLVALALTPSIVLSLDNGLGHLPPMGWNSWNRFGCNISETLIKETADVMVSSGLAKAGYEYVNLDDCWQVARDADGKIVVDQERFPSGMKVLGDYIHSKGLKFGTYSSAGFQTCAQRPGSLGYEEIDAKTYAEWGIDLLKYDNCYSPLKDRSRQGNINRFTAMRDALNKTGRPIFYSMCNWGEAKAWEWAHDIANSYRTTQDIGDLWEGWRVNCPCATKQCILPFGANCSVINILDKNAGLTELSTANAWGDMDMLQVGNGGMTFTEQKSHFILWAFLKSPLILGHDVRTMTPEILSLLTSPEIIAVNQDQLAHPAVLLKREYQGGFFGVGREILVDVWKVEVEGGVAIAILNRTKKPRTIKLPLATVFGDSFTGQVKIRDLYNREDLGTFSNEFVTGQLASHDTMAIKILKV
ncbi:putative alpha-galactosidase [Paraphysoderma sedebokerense]|nr:putative alpha-galactosidase [Paraphysoderma sedebokerense]